MYLVDTNVFLEILLSQEKKEEAKRFLIENEGKLSVSDFALHSIGIILFKLKRPEVFREFLNDVLPNVTLLTLPEGKYEYVVEIHLQSGLDFDDAYQCALARTFNLTIATLDSDLLRAPQDVKVKLL
ncbi:PIN domain-containing protein [Thermococcus sp. Bubb.Bath]|uniref:type II toxin-antitoxin system VapC family toxin n=1 Tax=Thermococcus sp. Bubb.Bath TaxID=1638242 RepID=UPI00143A0672|nr:PIN domain-containing protein [Thermococcus sp. Bubb.Bath]NJF25658.1 PIN domain-containing protein [Thermococcus sp. Bubb.Bath]